MVSVQASQLTEAIISLGFSVPDDLLPPEHAESETVIKNTEINENEDFRKDMNAPYIRFLEIARVALHA